MQSDLPARRQFPRSRLADAVRGVEEISAAYGVAIATLGHAGDGNLHPTMVTPRGDAEAWEGEVQAFDAVLDPGPAAGRDVTGERVIGLLKRPALRRSSTTSRAT